LNLKVPKSKIKRGGFDLIRKKFKKHLKQKTSEGRMKKLRIRVQVIN
jgi:hypothetical protein